MSLRVRHLVDHVQVLVMSEAALRTHPARSRPAERLHPFVSLSELATIYIGVVQFPTMAATTLSCFGLIDDTVVWVETLTGRVYAARPGQATFFENLQLCGPYLGWSARYSLC